MPTLPPRRHRKATSTLTAPAPNADRWRALALATGQITWISDRDGHATELASWCGFTGQPETEARGLGWIAALHPEDQANMPEFWAKIVAEGVPFDVEMRARRADGEYRLLQGRGVPIRDVAGEISEWVGVIQDITEQRALAERMQRHSQEMEELISAVSHELRHPLTIIGINGGRSIRYLQAALHAPSLVETRGIMRKMIGLLDRCAHQSKRMTRLVEDLVDIAHMEAGKFKLALVPGDLGGLIHSAVIELSQTWPERTVNFAMEPGAQFPVMFDADRIEQVIDNLVSNAHKYSLPGGAIHVTVSTSDASARVAIRDEGPGIPLDAQAHIWEKNFQMQNTSTERGSRVGIGLGLFLCHAIILAHGGQIDVTSTPGQGATFWFTLPLLTSEPES